MLRSRTYCKCAGPGPVAGVRDERHTSTVERHRLDRPEIDDERHRLDRGKDATRVTFGPFRGRDGRLVVEVPGTLR